MEFRVVAYPNHHRYSHALEYRMTPAHEWRAVVFLTQDGIKSLTSASQKAAIEMAENDAANR